MEDLRVELGRGWNWTPLSKDNAINISFLIFVCTGSRSEVDEERRGVAEHATETANALQPYRSENTRFEPAEHARDCRTGWFWQTCCSVHESERRDVYYLIHKSRVIHMCTHVRHPSHAARSTDSAAEQLGPCWLASTYFVSGLLWLHTDGEVPRGGTEALDDSFDTDVLTIAGERHWSGSLCIEYRPK
jgi:hypothetical protein